MNKRQVLRVLRDEWEGCTSCSYHELRNGDQIIFGSGSLSADYMFIGAGPSFTDEVAGTPYTGEPGDLLFALTDNVGIDTNNIYMTYAVACVPKVIIPETETESEKLDVLLPSREALDACSPRLKEQIYVVDPRIIVAFGEEPLRALGARDNVGKRPGKMAEAHGKLYDIYIQGRTGAKLRYPVMSALGIDYLMKNPSEAAHGPIASTREALHRAHSYVEWLKEREK